MKKGSIIASTILISVTLLIVSGLAIAQAAESDWPMFHNDLSHTGYSTSTALSASPTLWSHYIGTSVRSSPAVVNGVVYVGSMNRDLYALNGTTGAEIWSYYTGYSFPGGVSSSPAVDNGVVYVGSQSSNVCALEAGTGTQVWSQSINYDVYISSPAAADGVVYIGNTHGNLYALNESTGAVIWTCGAGGAVVSSPAVADGVVFVGSEDYNVYAFNASTGAKIWNYPTGGAVDSSPAVVNGVVYVGSDDYNVYALDASTGSKIWSYRTGYWVESSPAVVNGVVYVGSDDHTVYALDASTGAVVWSYATGNSVVSSPAVVNGVVYVGSDDHNVYGLTASTGSMLMRYATGAAVDSSPAVADGVVYVGSEDGFVYAINAATSVTQHLTVTSAYGSPTPPTSLVGQGMVINESVASPVDGPAGTRYVCTGWTGTGSVPASGTGTSVTFILMEDSSITWNWKTQYYLTVNSAYETAGGAGWYDSGSTAYATLTASSGAGVAYVFSSWGTDASGTNYASSNAITMNGSKTATTNWISSNPTIWRYPIPGHVRSSPTVANSVVFVGADDYCLHALNASTGTQLWYYYTGGIVESSPAVVNGVVYFGSSASVDNVYALDASTGAKIWSYSVTSGVYTSSPAVANGVVYIGSEHGGVYALNASTGTLIWTYATGGSVDSPAVVDGVVYVGSGDFNVYAFNATTGQKIWSFLTGSYVYSSPAVVNGVVYVGSDDYNVYALDASTGAKIWSYNTAYPVESSPAVVNGVLYVGSDNHYFHALDASTGAPLWSFPTGGDVYSSPTVVNGVVYVGSDDNNVYALNATTGAALWSYATGDSVKSSPTVVNGVVYVGSDDYRIYAIKAGRWVPQLTVTSAYGSPTPPTGLVGQGTVVTASVASPVTGPTGVQYVCTGWTGTGSVPASGTDTSVTFTITEDSSITWNWKTQYYLTVTSAYATPSGAGWYDSGSMAHAGLSTGTVSGGADVAYVFSSWGTDASGTNYASSNAITMNGPKTATTNWIQCNPTLWSYHTGSSVESSPAVVNGVVYVGSDDCSVYALDASTGAKLWSYPTGDWVHSSPAVANGKVYLGSEDGSVYALDASTGAELWSYPTGSSIYSSPAVANGVVFIGSSDKNVYALDALTGAKLWSYATGSYVESSPTVFNGVVYIGSDDGNVYALNALTGEKIWSYATGAAVASSPVVANGIVYVGSNDNNVYALNAQSGSKIWSYATGGWVVSSPVMANGVVYVGSEDSNVYALDASTGAKIWNYPTGNWISSSPTVANGVVYIGSDDCNLYSLNASTGAQIWNYPTEHWVASSPVVANDIVYVGGDDGFVYAIKAGSWATQQLTLTVTSAQGSPSPSTGSFDQGTVITEYVTSPVEGPAGIRYVCTGWTGTGSVPASGTGTSVTFTISEDSTITWHWKIQYLLTLSSAYDTPNQSGSGWYDSGSTPTIAITSTTISGGTDIRYVFTGWASSDTGGYTGSSASHTVTMNGPITETANWKTQYQVTFSADPTSGGTTNPTGTNVWEDAGSLSISSTSNTGYTFDHWSTTGSISFASSTSPSTTATISGIGKITANFIDNTKPISSVGSLPTYETTLTFNVPYTASDQGSGVNYVELFYSKDGGAWTKYGSTYTTSPISFTGSGDGLYEFYTVATDNAGNVEDAPASADASITLDIVAPIGSVSINSGAAYATSTGVTLTLSASDTTSGVASMRFSNDGSTWSNWEAYGTSKPWTLTSVDGSKTVYVQFKDSAGNPSTTYSNSIVLDTVAPNGSISINSGDAYTDSTSATLTLSANDANGVAQMRFSTDGSSWQSWESYTTSKAWTLTGTDGTKTVYVEFKDAAGLISTSNSDSIILDTTNPVVTINAPAAGWYQTSTLLPLDYSVTDNLDSSPTVQTSGWSTAEGVHTVTITATDAAGNVGSASITYSVDNTKPVTIKALSGTSGSNGWYISNVDVTLTATDTGGSGVKETYYKLDGIETTVSGNYASFTISVEGTHTIEYWAVDNAGNIETHSTQTIMVDKTAPTGGVLTADRSPDSNGWYNHDVTWTASGASDATSDGITYGSPVVYSGPDTSSATVSILVTDAAGNWATLTQTFKYDATTPTLSKNLAGTLQPNGWYTTSVTVTLTSGDALSGVASVEYNLNGTGWTTYIGPFTITTEGSNTLQYSVTDNAGNTYIPTQTINIDDSDPTITITSPTNGLYLDPSTVSVSGTASDGAGVSKVELKVDSGSYSLATGTTSWSFTTASLSPGTHTITARVTDLGGTTAETSVEIYIGATSLTYSGATSGQYSDPVTISATLIDLATGNGISGKTVTFTIGTQTATVITNSLGVASTTLTLTQVSGSGYTVHTSFAGDSSYQASSDSDAFTISKEIVAITYTGDTFKSTDGAPSITATLSASLAQQADGSSGDLTLAKVTFALFKSSNLGSTPDVVIAGVSVDSGGIASITRELATDVWTVKVYIDTGNGYWTQGNIDLKVLTVTASTTSSVTGGGWIVDSGSANNKGNFGFNVQYNKHQDPKGSFVYIYRGSDGYDYIVKSNSWQGGGLSFTGTYSALFSGKCVIQKVDPTTGNIVDSAGNAKYSVSIVDGNTKGADTIAVSFSGTSTTTSTTYSRTIPTTLLSGGNIVVKST